MINTQLGFMCRYVLYFYLNYFEVYRPSSLLPGGGELREKN